MNKRKFMLSSCATVLLPALSSLRANAQGVASSDIREIAKEAYIYGFPMVDNYRVQYSYFVDPNNPDYKAPYNQLFNIPRVFTPEDKAIQTPNSDTPYSWIGLDLRAEPIVFTVPPIEKERYWSLQLIDLYTHNFDYLGSRTTGNNGGSYMIAGPQWQGETPAKHHQGHTMRDQHCLGTIPDPALQSRRPGKREDDTGEVHRKAAVGVPWRAIAATGTSHQLS